METGSSFCKREDVQIICFRQRDFCHTDGVTLLNLPEKAVLCFAQYLCFFKDTDYACFYNTNTPECPAP